MNIFTFIHIITYTMNTIIQPHSYMHSFNDYIHIHSYNLYSFVCTFVQYHFFYDNIFNFHYIFSSSLF